MHTTNHHTQAGNRLFHACFNRKGDLNFSVFNCFAKTSVATFSLSGIFRCYINLLCRIIVEIINVTLSHLRSKEITGIHEPCIPYSNHSRATSEYKPVYVTQEHGGHQKYTQHLDPRL